jgi:hypothetical protein
MERSDIRDGISIRTAAPDFALLNPGYTKSGLHEIRTPPTLIKSAGPATSRR